MLCTSISFFTLSLIHNGQCVAEKSHWDKPPMCTKKLCFSYVFTFALAKRQIKTLRCSFHFALYLYYYYLCQSKRKFRIRSRTFKALLFHVSMTWSQPKSNQLQFMISSAATTFQCCHTRGNVAVNSPLDKSLQCETNCVLKLRLQERAGFCCK